ncbi:hypothetical protein BDZ97DRAFT_1764365 [Flammula alnicola]|nr:hypothetical protein BDZ97DRAFT_1764365 [Flammula alnicola]
MSSFSPSTATAAALTDPGTDDLSTKGSLRHEKFYLPDFGMAIFNIQGRLYKVHRHFFIQESEVFKSMFDCPSAPGGNQDGDSDEKPIHLPEVTCAEFETLLELIYDGMLGSWSIRPGLKKPGLQNLGGAATSNTLYDLLSISLRYAFDRVTSQVVAAIQIDSGDQAVSMDPLQKIILALKHDVLRHWLKPAFDELVNRSTHLTKEEMKTLGYNRAEIINGRREDRMMGRRDVYYGNLNCVPSYFFFDD